MICGRCSAEIRFEREERECFNCNGSGRDAYDRCDFCSGRGWEMSDVPTCECDDDDYADEPSGGDVDW